MALQTSGPISLQDIQNEFGGGNPINISEYYRGGTYVPNSTTNSNIPTGGVIKLSDFYGGSNEIPITYTQHTLGYDSRRSGNACDNLSTRIVYQSSDPFVFTDPIYSDSNGTNFSGAGWYSNGIGVREWSGSSWLGGGATLCDGFGFDV